jgi:hypothetical protein
MRIEVIDYAAMVDELAELKAAIAPLQEREASLKELLKSTGRDRIDGTKHTAVITLSERESVDTKALRADLGDDLIAPYLKRSIVETLKLTARKTH